MNALLRSKFSLSLGLSLAMLVAASSARGQSISLSFRFDGANTGNTVANGATNVNLAAGSAGQTYTVDVWATITGDANHTNTANYGIKNIQFQGFSDVVSGGAFTTGAGIGVVASSFVGQDSFAGHVNQPGVADTGKTTGNGLVVAAPDGILDFGKNSALSNENSSLTTGYELGSSFGQAGSAAGTWEFQVLKFKLTIGTVGTSGVTQFYPVLPNSTTMVNYTVDGGTTAVQPATWTVGSPLTFTVAQAAGSAIAVTADPPPVGAVLKGGSVGLTSHIKNNGPADLAAAGYTYGASGGTAISYSAMASQAITNGNTANFSTTATTSPGPGGTPIGLATVTFTATGVGGAVTNSPQTATVQLNVGGATADNSNAAGVYGPALTALVQGGGSYGGLESAVVAVGPGTGSNATGPNFLGGHATILAGVDNSPAAKTASMAWRTRLTPSESPGTRPPLPVGTTTPLSSNVVNVSGLETGEAGNATDDFVLDMSYNPVFLPKGGSPAIESGLAANKLIYMVSPNGADGAPYVNTVSLNVPTAQNPGGNNVTSPADPRYGFQGSYAAFTGAFGANLVGNLGAWGVDTSTHEVWAIVDHNSTFAVIPEPSTILLAGLGLLGVVALRRRAK